MRNIATYFLKITCVLFLFVSFDARSAILTQTLENVSILGSTYNVRFIQDDLSPEANSFNSIQPTITFTTYDSAYAAAVAILDVAGPGYDYTPASWANSSAFRIPVEVLDIYSYNLITAGMPGSPSISVLQTSSPDSRNSFSYAQFDLVSSVPVPPALWLFVSGLLMLARPAGLRLTRGK